MINRFEEVFKQITANTSINENDVEKMVNVASIIEKEARVDEDRPLIASVIYNRINQNMPLQIDATVIYAHGYYIESVRNRHLAIESKYNTYLYKGLPVGPICNPGIESLKAALNPASTDYLFYLLAGENKHYFTNNYNDFLKKKRRIRIFNNIRRFSMSGVAYDYMEEYIRGLIPESTGKLKELEDLQRKMEYL